MIEVRKFRPVSGRGWFYEAACPHCKYIGLTSWTKEDAVFRTEAHIGWWHIQLGHWEKA